MARYIPCKGCGHLISHYGYCPACSNTLRRNREREIEDKRKRKENFGYWMNATIEKQNDEGIDAGPIDATIERAEALIKDAYRSSGYKDPWMIMQYNMHLNS